MEADFVCMLAWQWFEAVSRSFLLDLLFAETRLAWLSFTTYAFSYI